MGGKVVRDTCHLLRVEGPGEATIRVTCTRLSATAGCCHQLGMPGTLGGNGYVEMQTTLSRFLQGLSVSRMCITGDLTGEEVYAVYTLNGNIY